MIATGERVIDIQSVGYLEKSDGNEYTAILDNIFLETNEHLYKISAMEESKISISIVSNIDYGFLLDSDDEYCSSSILNYVIDDADLENSISSIDIETKQIKGVIFELLKLGLGGERYLVFDPSGLLGFNIGMTDHYERWKENR